MARPSWLSKPAARGIVHGYRSGLEDKNAKHLEAHGQTVSFETLKIPYEIPATMHKYTPDFPMANGIIVETKGIFDATDRAKHLYLKAQYPELDIRFVFSRSAGPIGPKAKMTLADWCIKHGYRYADKLIPPEWMAEPGPERKPAEVLADGPFGTTRAYAAKLRRG